MSHVPGLLADQDVGQARVGILHEPGLGMSRASNHRGHTVARGPAQLRNRTPCSSDDSSGVAFDPRCTCTIPTQLLGLVLEARLLHLCRLSPLNAFKMFFTLPRTLQSSYLQS